MLSRIKLKPDELRAISRQLPTPEEITRIKDFEDIGKLTKSDQYFSQISTVPRLPQRLECMLYRRKLELEVEEIRPDMQTVRDACKDLRASQRFKVVLQVVLAVGNALNGSTFRGNARGFQLEALIKLKETKTAKGGPECPTLLHYLARVLLRTDPELVNFIDEMRSVEAAARISAQTLLASAKSLVTGLEQIEEEVQVLKKTGVPSGDRFIFVMKPFLQEARKSVDALRNMASALEVELRSLFLYYGESADTAEGMKAEDFFGMILSFSTSLQKSALEVYNTQERQEVGAPKVIVSEAPAPVAEEGEIKPVQPPTTNGLAPPPRGDGTVTPTARSYGRAGGNTIQRGDFDQAIRGMLDGTQRRRRENNHRPLSRIFVDGSRQSRALE